MFGTAQAVLIRGVSLFQGGPYRGGPLCTVYDNELCFFWLRVAMKSLFVHKQWHDDVACVGRCTSLQ